MTARPFFSVSAAMEVGAGLVLLIAPAPAIEFVLGISALAAGVAIGRVAGAALLSLGAACWLARPDGGSAASRGLVSALLVYNAVVAALVLSTSMGSLTALLWSVAVLHVAMALWCLLLLRRSSR